MVIRIEARGAHLTIFEEEHARGISALNIVGGELVPADLSGESEEVQAAAAKHWTPEVIEALRRQLAPVLEPEPLDPGEARARLLIMLDAAARPILAAYPEAERLSWPAKEAEAAAVLAADVLDLDAAPLLLAEIAAQQAIAPAAVTAEQLATKAATVLAKAAAWRALISAVSGLRQRYEAAIAGAEDDPARRDVLAAAAAETMGLAGPGGSGPPRLDHLPNPIAVPAGGCPYQPPSGGFFTSGDTP